MTPKKFFKFFAFAEVVTWALLITGMILKYGTKTTELGVRIGGGIHGFVFICFVIAVVLVGTSQRWGKKRTATGLVSAIIPFATVPFEISAAKTGILDGEWQLAPGGREPQNWFEKLCAWAIRSPLAAVGVGVVGVVVIFTVLLILGPPIG